jgi:hypothetical protein
MVTTTRPTLGVDVGGVIIQRVSNDADTSFFSGKYLSTPPVAGCIDALRALVESPFGKNVYIVSKCGPEVERRTREWLEHHRIYRETGIQRDQVHFTLTRAGKAPICELLGITHFIDDRLDVLQHLTSVPQRYLFVGGNPADMRATQAPDGINVAATWIGLLALIRTRSR